MKRTAPVRFAVAVFGLIDTIGVLPDDLAVDPQTAIAHLHAIARQSDDTLDPDLRTVGRRTEHDDIAARRQFAEDALRRRQA